MNNQNPQPQSVLCCQNLVKTFTDADQIIRVLTGINFSVNPGETVAIIGASGSGKSTLLHLLGGLDKPTAGDVWIANESIATLNEKTKGQLRNQYLGFVYQFHHLLPEFDALENVCLPLLIRGLSPKLAIQQAMQVIEKVGLAHRAKHRVGELSGGERQRIAIARALVTQPKCVLADEPTGNLDEATANAVMELILQLNQQLKTSFVIVTHNRILANKMQRVFIMENGLLHLNEKN